MLMSANKCSLGGIKLSPVINNQMIGTGIVAIMVKHAKLADDILGGVTRVVKSRAESAIAAVSANKTAGSNAFAPG